MENETPATAEPTASEPAPRYDDESWWHIRMMNGDGFVVREPDPAKWPAQSLKFFSHITFVEQVEVRAGNAKLRYQHLPQGAFINMSAVINAQWLDPNEEGVSKIRALAAGLHPPPSQGLVTG